MKKVFFKSITLVFLLFLTNSVFAQHSTEPLKAKLIHSGEFEIQYGQGGGILGIMGKANHQWFKTGNFRLQSGLLGNLFYSSEDIQNEEPVSSTSSNFDFHLQLHTGIEQSFFKNRLYIALEVYIGFYGIFTEGYYKNSSLGINRNYQTSAYLLDYGSRFVLGYKIKEQWGIQLSFNNSWRQVNSPLGFLLGLLAGQPDAKYSLGIGINYKFP